MSSSRRRAILFAALALVGVGIAGWGLAGWPGLAASDAPGEPVATAQEVKPAVRAPGDKVRITGAVFDRVSARPVGNVMVVLLAASGANPMETKVMANAAGAFEIAVAPGRYRTFVRDDNVLTVGMQARIRLDDHPRRELADTPDLASMPVLDAFADATDIEVYVERAALLSGFVFAPDHQSVAGAIVRLRGPPMRLPFSRPALGTDIARTDANGRFTLRVPAGLYDLDATHEDFAGLDSESGGAMILEAGREEHVTLDLARGCIITGRVSRPDGTPAGDGALERYDPDRASGFGPVGRVGPDGAFRLTVTDNEMVVLRAWPWKAPPAGDKTFSCRDGKRFANALLELADRQPDLVGTIVDANGARVPFAYVDVQPRDWTFGGQQERADAGGEWGVFDLLPGNYRITATAPGLGITDLTIASPRRDVQLQLSGTGRIAGTTTDLVTGSFEVSFKQCGAGDDPIELAPETRIVIVTAGRFSIDRVPACALTLVTRWRDRVSDQHVVVEPDRTSYLELAVGTPREKTVHGVVLDKHRKPVANARITAVLGDKESMTVRSDTEGRFEIVTSSGAQLVGGNGRFSGRAVVGRANVASEQVDLVLEEVDSSY